MAHAQNSLVINRPVTAVFDFIAYGLNTSAWRAGVVSIALVSGQAGQEGAVYKQVLKGPGGRTIAGDFKVTAAKVGQEFSFMVIAGPARPEGHYYFEQAPGGTKVTFVLDYQPKGLAKLLGPMIQKTMNSEVAQLSKLKEVLERS